MRSDAFKKTVSYLAIYSIWSSTYFFISVAVKTIPPVWLLALRWSVAGLLFMFLPIAMGKVKKIPSKQEFLSAACLGVLFMLLGNGLVSVAEKNIDSYVAALIVATVPCFVSIINRVLFKVRVSFVKVISIVLGVVGVALLLYQGKAVFSLEPEVLMVVGATIFWSIGTCLVGHLKLHQSSFFNAGMQMFTAGFLALLLAIFTTKDISTVFNQISAPSLRAMLFLVVFGSLAIVAYNYLLQREPALRVSTYTFVNPILATLLGVLVVGELVRPLLFIGMPLILLGLTGIVYGEKFFVSKSRASIAAASVKEDQ